MTGVREAGACCEALPDGEARCRPDGITSVVIRGDLRRDDWIDVDMSDRESKTTAPASVSVSAGPFDQDHIHTKDGVHQTLSCNTVAGDHGSIIDDEESPPGCAYPGAFGASTFGNGLYMNPKGIVQVGIYCRHDYGSEPCTGVLRPGEAGSPRTSAIESATAPGASTRR